MSGDDTNDYELSRRTFARAAGAAAGGGLLGTSMGSVAGGTDPSDSGNGTGGGGELFDTTFANPRVREAKKVWDRGFRGRRDRTIGLTDSGLDARHPDIGPWNGVRAIDDDGTFRLVDPDESMTQRTPVPSGKTDVKASTTVGPGAFPAGSEKVLTEFTPSSDADWAGNNYSGMQLLLDATLSWSPNASASNDLEFRIDRQKSDGSWEQHARTATASEPEKLTGVPLEFDTTYRMVAEMYINTTTTATVKGNYFRSMSVYEEVEGDIFDLPAADGSDAQPKCVGWADPDPRFGTLAEPRDPDGHGSHCTSIMGGSGRASAIHSIVEQDDDMATVLIPGDFLEYEVEVDPSNGEGGLYVSAYGENLELFILNEDESETLDSSTVDAFADSSTVDNNVAEAPVEEAGTYTVRVKPADANAAGQSAGATVSTGRVEALSVGRLATPQAGEDDHAADGEVSLHSGMAPDAGLVGLQGFGAPVAMLAKFGQEFSSQLNLRSVNMSWGYQGGLPLGGLGQGLDGGVVADVKTMAQKGILTVAAAGNAATPANGNGAPAVADEALSVVATGPRDGIAAYSSGGLGGNDEDGEGTYMKPDVTAPGGTLTDMANAAKADSNTDDFDKQATDDDYDRPRDYVGKPGTSMASPYTNGTAGLVAEAMEFTPEGEKRRSDAVDDPDAVTLPEPASTELDDVMRLKSVLLSTASQTAFTAAPYHRAKAPSYRHGERDPFEGYGRVNPDAAVDAVTRELLSGLYGLPATESTSATSQETVGLDVPEDSRAVAGFVDAPEGTLDVSMSFTNYSGDDKGLTKGSPWLDLFVYDAAAPAANGEPAIVASAEGRQGSGSVSVDVGDGGGTYLVVAKLVNVPGVVNGFDVQANFDLTTEFTRAALPTFTASGRRSDDATQYTAGATNEVHVEIDSLSEVSSAKVRDRIPADWTVLMEFSDDVERVTTEGDTKIVHFAGSVEAADLSSEDPSNDYGEDAGEFKYLVEAPEEAGEYTFGPAFAEVANPKRKGVSNPTAEFGGTDTNLVVSTSTSSDSDSTTDTVTDTTDSTTDTTDSTTDTTDSTINETTSTLEDTV